MQYKWNIRKLSSREQIVRDQLAADLNITAQEASLLVVRGLHNADEAHQFIAPKLSDLHDPFLMKDMDKAVERLTTALQNNEKILVYGDYDVDGTTAVSLVYKFLNQIYTNIDFYIPDRYTEGYGISLKGIDYAKENNCSLIIALDCGIKANMHVDYANERGIDFIICDHHMPGAERPNAVAVLDPKQEDCHYPYDELSGCGVGFKFMYAFALRNNINIKEQLLPLLELLAMSIASDIVPITGENRILAYYGLRQINHQPSVGVSCILERAGVEMHKININDLIYKLGPRINACGRIKSGREAVRLLITSNPELARQISEDIDEYNQTRKDKDQEITTKALEMLAADPEYAQMHTTVVCGEDWHKGVLGIVASRLTETYYRPTIVLTETDGIVSGSARSVGGFDIYSAIDSCSDLLTNFGGHVFAAGLSMKVENLDEFKRRFEAYVSAHILPEQMTPVIDVEAEIDFQDITNHFWRVLEALEPFGPGNDRPVFVTRRVCNYRYSRAVGNDNKHLRLDVTDRTGVMNGIAFGMGEMAKTVQNGTNIDVCYEIDLNTFNGNSSLQMMVKDIKVSDSLT